MTTEFNFDEWKTLYETNPEEYERRRTETVRAVIDSAPAELQLSLLQLQWKLDGIHKTNTPIGGLLKMQGMMWDSFLKMNDSLQTLAGHADDLRVLDHTAHKLRPAANDC